MMEHTSTEASPIRRIAVFIAMTVGLTAVFWWLSWLSATGRWQFGAQKTRELFVTGLMWCPGIAALITCRITGKSWRELGLDPPALRFLGLAFLLPLFCMALAYFVLWGSGLAALDAAAFVDGARKRFSLPGTPAWAIVALSFVLTASVGVLNEIGRSLGEELGWRGFLVPELLRRHGLALTSVLSGLIWGAWHFPLFIPLGSETPLLFALGCFLASVVAISFIAAWLRWRSGSVWPAVILHSTHNALLYPFFDAMTSPGGTTAKYAVGEMGIALVITYSLGAAMLWRATRVERIAA